MANYDLNIKLGIDDEGLKKGIGGAARYMKVLKKDIEQVNDTIIEQKNILADFKRELQSAQDRLKQTSKSDVAAQKALKKEIAHLTEAYKDQQKAVTQLSNLKTDLNGKLKVARKESDVFSASVNRIGETARSALPSVGGLVSGFTGMSVAMLVAEGVKTLAESIFKLNKEVDESKAFRLQVELKPFMDELKRAEKLNKTFLESKKRINASFDDGAKKVLAEGNQVKLYYNIATDLNQSYENRKNALSELQKIAPKYFDNFTTETILTDKATKAYGEYNKALVARIQAAGLLGQAEAASAERAKAMGELIQLMGKDADKLDFSLSPNEFGKQINDFVKGISNEVQKDKILDAADLYKYYTKEVDKFVGMAAAYQPDITPVETGGGTEETKDPALELFKANDELSKQSLILENLGFDWSNFTQVFGEAPIKSVTNDVSELTGGMQELTLATDEQTRAWVETTKEAERAAQAISDAQQKAANMEAVAGGVANAFDTLGGVFSEQIQEADTALAAFGGVLLETISKLFGMAIANAIVGATQSGVGTGPAAVFTTPAFITTAMGGVTAAFASAAKFKPKGFADGGLIGGNSFSGDRLLAPVNSGEVILNTGQQNELLRIANGSAGGGTLMHRIEGRDLLIWLNRAQKDYSRG